ncbi:MAG: hypothetical protein CR972_04165, partial [Candidatus Moraniibacteriota bacterium]
MSTRYERTKAITQGKKETGLGLFLFCGTINHVKQINIKYMKKLFSFFLIPLSCMSFCAFGMYTQTQ